MANIIATYSPHDLGMNDTFAEIAYLHQENETAYWWLNNTHHDYSRQMGIYSSAEEAVEALKENWTLPEIEDV